MASSSSPSDLFTQLRELVKGSEITIMLSIAVGMVVWRMMGSSEKDKSKDDKKEAKREIKDRPNEVLEFRDYTRELLATYNGTVMGKPLLMGILGKVYDVTAGADFYGPGGPYGAFAGRDASRMLSKMQTAPDEQDPSIDDILPEEKDTLDNWAKFFEGKYKHVGNLVA